MKYSVSQESDLVLHACYRDYKSANVASIKVAPKLSLKATLSSTADRRSKRLT